MQDTQGRAPHNLPAHQATVTITPAPTDLPPRHTNHHAQLVTVIAVLVVTMCTAGLIGLLAGLGIIEVGP